MINIGNIVKITGAQLALVLADNTQLTIGSDRISMNGIVLDNSTSLDGQFTIGAAVTGQMSVTLFNADEAYTQYNFRDATAQLTFTGPTSIPDDDDDVVTIDSVIVGQYNIADYAYDGSNIVLTAYDNLCKLDVPCTETNGTTVSFPITTKALVTAACTICGVTLADSVNPIPNGTYSVAQKPEQWDTMTWHDIISYCAQIGGVYAKTDKYGRLFFDWYDITTQQTDPDAQVIPSPYALSTDTDDVYITGLKVVLEASDNINADENTQQYTTALYGTDGYVITISGNPLIQTTTQADSIKNYLGAVAVGMYFRPLTATIVEDPTVETGDQVFITGRNSAVYQCIVSHVTYTTNAATVITCDAEPVKSNLKTRFTAADKLASHVEKVQRKLENTYKIAGNTNQYFWHQETGMDTGAHITEVPKDEWEDSGGQYYHSGGNLLARSNGIAVRDGLTELALFKADGIDFYDQQGANVVDIATNSQSYLNEFAYTLAFDVAGNESSTLDVDDPYFLGFENYTGESYNGVLKVDSRFTLVSFNVDFTADFTKIAHISYDGTNYIDVQVDYSYVDKTFTVTNPSSHVFAGGFLYLLWNGRITSSSFSFGRRSTPNSKGPFSGIVGEGLDAKKPDQFAIGRYNYNRDNTMFEIGGGANEDDRQNLFEVYKTTGNVKAKGSLEVGSVTATQKNLGIVSGTIEGGSVSSGGIKDFPINFGKTFSEKPNVVVGFMTNADQGNFGRCCCAVLMSSLTTSGCTIRIYNGDAQGRSPRCNWIAIGQ